MDALPMTMGRVPTLLGPAAARPGTARAERSGCGQGPSICPPSRRPQHPRPCGAAPTDRLGPGVCPPSWRPQHPQPCAAAPTDRLGPSPCRAGLGAPGCLVWAWPGGSRLCSNGGLCLGRVPRPPLLSWLTTRRSSTGAMVCGRATSRRCFPRSPRRTWRPSGCARRPSYRLRCGFVHGQACTRVCTQDPPESWPWPLSACHQWGLGCPMPSTPRPAPVRAQGMGPLLAGPRLSLATWATHGGRRVRGARVLSPPACVYQQGQPSDLEPGAHAWGAQPVPRAASITAHGGFQRVFCSDEALQQPEQFP